MLFPKRLQCSVLAALITLGIGVETAKAGIPALELRWYVDNYLVYDGTPGGTDNGNGTYNYGGSWTDFDDDGGNRTATFATLGWNITGDPDPQISGNLVVENPFMPQIDVVLEVILPIFPTLGLGTEMLGSAAIGLTSDDNGGTVASIGGTPVWQGILDGVDAVGATMFFAPFDLSNGGFGSSAANANFGIPNAVGGPPTFDTIGIRISFSITQNDQASITSVFRVTPAPGGLLLLGLGALGARRRRRR